MKKKEKLNILYEDKELIAVSKKAGLLTIATDKEKENTLYHEVKEYLWKKNKNNKVFIIHRLDKDTSGIVLFAKNEKIKKYMQDNWDDVKRSYIALVHGKVEKKKDTIVSYLKETSTFLVYETKNKNIGKKAITNYELIMQNDNFSLLDVNIETGRKNQIRVQLAGINHPIVGDRKYGKKNSPLRQMGLHAYKIEFYHPTLRKNIVLESNCPGYITSLLK